MGSHHSIWQDHCHSIVPGVQGEARHTLNPICRRRAVQVLVNTNWTGLEGGSSVCMRWALRIPSKGPVLATGEPPDDPQYPQVAPCSSESPPILKHGR